MRVNQVNQPSEEIRTRLAIPMALLAATLVLGAIALRPRIAQAAMLEPGQPAPDFSTQMVTGDQVSPVRLADFRGRKLVLYFYPKDETPGCTKEACAFRDGYARLTQHGIAVLGCSVDSADAHKEFIRKYHLPFPLLLDPDHTIAKAYGAANGIPILGLDRRVTYVIGEDGKITKVYPKVDPAIHATEIIHDLGADKPVVPKPVASPAANAPGAASTGGAPASQE